MKQTYNWIYNTSNDNMYILLIIIIILIFIILFFDFWKTKKDMFNTIPLNNTYPQINNNHNHNNNNNNNNHNNHNNIIHKDLFYNVENNDVPETTYKAPNQENPAFDSLFISPEEKEQYKMAQGLLDGDESSLPNTNGTNYFNLPQNDILQEKSTLFNNDNNINNLIDADNNMDNEENTVGNYASLDSLGKGLTDTLGGIHTELGYTVLEEQLGTFKKEPVSNPHTYDNTSNYNTGINPKTVNGVTSYGTGLSGKFSQDHKPIFLQKDFDGVANIFAPNIIVQNPPLTSDGYPDISFDM